MLVARGFWHSPRQELPRLPRGSLGEAFGLQHVNGAEGVGAHRMLCALRSGRLWGWGER